MSSSSSVVNDDNDDINNRKMNALLLALQSFDISPQSLWPSCVYSSINTVDEVIANLDECFLPLPCYALLPFPTPQSKENSIEHHLLAKSLAIVSHLPLFAVFSIVTPMLMLMSSGMPSRQKIYDCDEAILHLRRIFAEDYRNYSSGDLAEFAKLESSRLIIDKVRQLEMNRMAHERAVSSSNFTHSWPKHTSTFAALHLYNVMIITILSLAVANGGSNDERERLTNHHQELDDRLGTLFQEFMNDSAMRHAIKLGHVQLEKKFGVYDLLIPFDLVDRMRSYTYRVLELFEHCVMSMMEIPLEIQNKLVCTCQIPLIEEDANDDVTQTMLEEQSHVIMSRCDFNTRIWANLRSITKHSKSRHIYRRRPYQEWVMNACIRYTFSAQKIQKNRDYLRRVVLGATIESDENWSSIHFNYDEGTNSIFRSIH